MKYLLDTNVYFRALRDPSFEPFLSVLARLMPRLWLSSVVHYELLAGARGDLGRAAIARLTRPLVRAERIIAPLGRDWTSAGETQSRLWDAVPSLRTKRLQNDILIACSCHRIGAILVTENKTDFRHIRKYVDHVALAPAELEP